MFVIPKCCGNEHNIIDLMCTIGTVPYVDLGFCTYNQLFGVFTNKSLISDNNK